VRDYPCPEKEPIMIATIIIDWTEMQRIVRVKNTVVAVDVKEGA